uniref:Uncharacterized protein n=1 Tax=Entomoneis paludosa TaxID=265537 RepID=A0A6U2XFY2_9STRA|mmetsp:Transcript_12864/g.26683  ORF Transcript_12864/g.26683 Transcript_12864/m.26683 type:complete len:210 (+) Transcript_12864:2-631(+)
MTAALYDVNALETSLRSNANVAQSIQVLNVAVEGQGPSPSPTPPPIAKGKGKGFGDGSLRTMTSGKKGGSYMMGNMGWMKPFEHQPEPGPEFPQKMKWMRMYDPNPEQKMQYMWMREREPREHPEGMMWSKKGGAGSSMNMKWFMRPVPYPDHDNTVQTEPEEVWERKFPALGQQHSTTTAQQQHSHPFARGSWYGNRRRTTASMEPDD